MSCFFFFINAGESVIQDLKLVLIFKDTKYRFIHMFAELSGKTLGERFFFFFNLNASSCT